MRATRQSVTIGDIAARDLTSGSIPRHLIRLSAPVVLAMMLQSVYALVDLGFVRQLGEKAVAGLAISLQVFFIILALSQVIAVTTLARVSQAYGAGKVEDARGAFSAYAIIGLGLGALSAVTAFALAEPYVSVFTSDPEVASLGLAYYEVNTLTFFFQLLLIVFGSGFRGTGDTLTPMKLMILSVLCNIVLDPLLIFGLGPFPRLGIAGAAWATVISQGVAFLLYLVVLTRSRSERGLRWCRPTWSRSIFLQLFTRGLPAGVQFFLISVVLGIALGAMKDQHAAWTATAGGGFRVLQQTMLPMIALGSAVAAMTGQNVGAEEVDRVATSAWTALRWALGYAAMTGVLLFFSGSILGRIFIKNAADLPVAETYFRWSAPMNLAVALTFIPTWVLQAAGRSVLTLIGAVVRIVLLAALVYWAIPAWDLGPEWVFGASTATAFVEGALAVGFLGFFLRRLRTKAGAAGLAPAAVTSPPTGG